VRILLVACTAAVLAASATAAAAASGPTLELVRQGPLVVRGTSFVPGERVVVTALTPTGPRRTVAKATRSGGFRATLRLPAQACGRAFMVVARGGTGTRALLRLAGRPCVPPPID